MAPNKDNLFGSKKQASLVKASQLDSTVRDILASEQTIREKKTARLRELRLQQEALLPPDEPKAKVKKKAAKTSG